MPKKSQEKESSKASYPLRIQAIRTKGQNVRFFVYLPMPLASALGVEGGESVSWELLARNELHLVRHGPAHAKTNKRTMRSGGK